LRLGGPFGMLKAGRWSRGYDIQWGSLGRRKVVREATRCRPLHLRFALSSWFFSLTLQLHHYEDKLNEIYPQVCLSDVLVPHGRIRRQPSQERVALSLDR
jgi:hypothetical protein